MLVPLLRKVALIVFAMAAAFSVSVGRADDTLLSNLPASDTGYYGLVSSSTFRAFSFTTSGATFSVTSVTMRLYDYISATDTALLSFQVNSGSNTPSGTAFATLAAPVSTDAGYGDFVFTPTSGITLEANTTYWLVIAATSDVNTFFWARSNPAVTPVSTPSGLATAGQQFISDNGNSNWHEGDDGPHSFSIQGVPEPGTCLLVGLGLSVAGLMAKRHWRR